MSRDLTAHPLTHTHPARPWTGTSNLGVCKCVINLLWQKESGGGGVETIWWVSIIPKGFPPSGSDDWEPGPQSSCFSPFVLLFWSTKNSLPLLPGLYCWSWKEPRGVPPGAEWLGSPGKSLAAWVALSKLAVPKGATLSTGVQPSAPDGLISWPRTLLPFWYPLYSAFSVLNLFFK